MQATHLTGFMQSKSELNHVKREKSEEQSLFSKCFCFWPALSLLAIGLRAESEKFVYFH